MCIRDSSDKCYENRDYVWGYRETDALGGKDPYSASKGCAEIVTRSYYNSFFSRSDSNVKIVSARAGNVIGGGDWAKDRILSDCVRAWSKNNSVRIRNPNATRPWQHVLESLSGYLLLGQCLYENSEVNGESFNFGPLSHQNYTVGELVSEIQKHWGDAKIEFAKINDGKKEARFLKLCCDKALHVLDWKPTLQFSESVAFTVDWYKNFYSGKEDVFKMTTNQIKQYVDLASQRKQSWVNVRD